MFNITLTKIRNPQVKSISYNPKFIEKDIVVDCETGEFHEKDKGSYCFYCGKDIENKGYTSHCEPKCKYYPSYENKS